MNNALRADEEKQFNTLKTGETQVKKQNSVAFRCYNITSP